MIKFLSQLFLIILLSLAGSWFYFYNQNITIVTSLYTIHISYFALTLLFLSILVITNKFAHLIQWIKFFPSNIASMFKEKKEENIENITTEIITIFFRQQAPIPIEKVENLAKLTEKSQKHVYLYNICKYKIACNFIEESKINEAVKILDLLPKNTTYSYFINMLNAKIKIGQNLYSEAYENICKLLHNKFRSEELVEVFLFTCSKLRKYDLLEATMNEWVRIGFLTQKIADDLIGNIYWQEANLLVLEEKKEQAEVLFKKLLKFEYYQKNTCLAYAKILEPEQVWELVEKIFKYYPCQEISDLLINVSLEKIELLSSYNPDSIFPHISAIKYLIKNNIPLSNFSSRTVQIFKSL